MERDRKNVSVERVGEEGERICERGSEDSGVGEEGRPGRGGGQTYEENQN